MVLKAGDKTDEAKEDSYEAVCACHQMKDKRETIRVVKSEGGYS